MAVECRNDVVVTLGDEFAAHLARACQLGVISIQLFVQQQEAPDARRFGQVAVGGFDLFTYKRIHFIFLRQVGIGCVGDLVVFGPFAGVGHVDIDHGGYKRPIAAKNDRFFDMWAEFQFVFDELGAELGAVV